MNEIGNALAMPNEDPVRNNIMCNSLEVCNKGGHQKKIQTPFNCVLVFHFQKAQCRFCQIATRYGCHEHVAEDVYCTTPTALDFGAGSSYAAGTSSAAVAHDDVPNLDLDTMADVLSQLEDAPDTTHPSQPLQGGQARQPPHRFTPGSGAVVQRKRGHRH
jgi:hypothetical protein